VYLRNFHGQEVLLRPESLTWRLLGGSIDLFFFDGPTPAEVTRQYQLSVTGLPAMQSYWTLGFHQCRWGYRNWTETREVKTSPPSRFSLANTSRLFKQCEILTFLWVNLPLEDIYDISDLACTQKQYGSTSTIWTSTATSL
jgi:hypothetical protein